MLQAPRLSIAILGAGPAGLTAANIFQRHGWSCAILEADASATARDQGGTLDLHPQDGQLALARAGLLEAFLAAARHGDQELRVRHHASGALLYEEIPQPEAGNRPEIDRVVLRQLLLEPLGTQAVRWGTRIDQVTTDSDGRHRLQGAQGCYGPFDLVIGADGAWSCVRAALTTVRPVYTDITFVELWLHDVDRRHPALAQQVGHGTLMCLHDGRGIFAQRNGNAMVRVYAALRTPPEASDRPDKTWAPRHVDALLTHFHGWAPQLQALIADADNMAAVRPIVALPTPLQWGHRSGLTLVGDAAHVMPPLGVGVNLAMLDASELAEALVHQSDWRAAVHDYEQRMLARSNPIAQQCAQSFAEWFDAPGAQVLLDAMAAHHAPQQT